MSEYIAKCNEVVGISGKTLIVPDYIDTSKEIVRCRDCIWFIDDPDMYTSRPFCDYLDGIHFKPDDFCSYGQRKEGGDD